MAKSLGAIGLRLTDQHCRRELNCRRLAGRGVGGCACSQRVQEAGIHGDGVARREPEVEGQ